MATKKTHDVVATVGSYKDNQGNEKKRYVNVGAAFTNDEGQMSIKLETVPVSPEWSGWLSLYVPKEREGGRAQQRQQAAPQTRTEGTYRKANVPTQPVDDSEEIPF